MSKSKRAESDISLLEEKLILFRDRIIEGRLSDAEREDISEHLLIFVRGMTENFIRVLNFKTINLLFPYQDSSAGNQDNALNDPVKVKETADPKSVSSPQVQSLKSHDDQLKSNRHLWNSSSPDDEILYISGRLSWMLLDGKCCCNNTRKNNNDQGCAREKSHSLRAWLEEDTGKTLGTFLSHALRGYFGKTMLIKEIQYGMTYICLHEAGLLFTENKIMNLCLRCRDDKGMLLRFEGHYCNECKTPFNESTMKRCLNEHFITELVYRPGDFWQCKGNSCGNVFPVRKGKNLDSCPYNGCDYKSSGRAKITKAYHREILDDEQTEPAVPSELPPLDDECCYQFSGQYIYLTELIFMLVTGTTNLTVDEWLEQNSSGRGLEHNGKGKLTLKKKAIRELFTHFLDDDYDSSIEIDDVRTILRRQYLTSLKEGMALTDIHLITLSIGDIRYFLRKEVIS
ncbi:MAG: hypothetical protein AB9903_28740 [Vulcanimicrobiota bacterium]